MAILRALSRAAARTIRFLAGGRKSAKELTLPRRRPCLDHLEDRTLLSSGFGLTIPVRGGQTTMVRDADGSLVKLTLTGPGYGLLTLTNGAGFRGDMNALTLKNTTARTSLTIVGIGGSIPGVSIHKILITKAANQLSALGRLMAPNLDLAEGGRLAANGIVGSIQLRHLSPQAEVAVTGNVGRFQSQTVEAYAYVHASGNINRFISYTLGRGALVSAGHRLGAADVPFQISTAARINAGPGGIGVVRAGDVEGAVISSEGSIGQVLVAGDMIATSVVANVKAGQDGQYGTGDDQAANPFVQGKIQLVRVGGLLAGSADPSTTEAIRAESVGAVVVRGKALALPTVHHDEVLGGIGGAGGGLGGGVAYSVAEFMGWNPTTPPTFSMDVDYASNTTWEGLNVINYEPAHYPNFDQSGNVVLNNGQPLPDPSFQANLATDFPPGGSKYGNFVNYVVGNPEVTIYNDLQQLQAAGFNGVRLYGAEPPKVYVQTIQAADRLSQASGRPFYVYYEVGTPDLSEAAFFGGTVAQREATLYPYLVQQGKPPPGPEGTLQILHYVINIVGPSVFSRTVPVVFFSHEMLVSPKGTNPTTLTDDNSSTPLLQWGINATRALLKKELGANPLPAVSTAVVAGQVVSVSTTYQPEVKKLIDTIQHDATAPISYDDYPFQWGDRYFDQKHDYVNDSSVIPNAYPAGAQYYDNTSWSGGPLPPPTWTVPQTVTKADLMWSLQWMTDRVNWIWGHLANKGDQVKQLIAETGWASDGAYQDPSNKPITGNLQDAKDYFNTLQPSGFKVANAPVMYFMAYDVPWKATESTLFSENHYGVLGWSNLTKLIPGQAQYAPLTRPFAVLALAPTNGPGGVVYANPGQTGRSTAYSYYLGTGESTLNIPWYWGSTIFSNNSPNPPSITWIPSPAILISEGSILTVISPMPGQTYPSQIQFTFSATAGNGGTPGVVATGSVQPSDIGANLQQSAGWSLTGNPAVIYFAYAWLHDGTTSTANMVPIYEDFWAD